MKEPQQPASSSKSLLKGNTYTYCEPGSIHQPLIYITPCTSRAFRQAVWKSPLLRRRAKWDLPDQPPGIACCKGTHRRKTEPEITLSSLFSKGNPLQPGSSKWWVQQALPQPAASSWACLATAAPSTTADSHGTTRAPAGTALPGAPAAAEDSWVLLLQTVLPQQLQLG